MPVDEKQGPDRIPKVIHQVLLGSELPVAQDYFLAKTRKVYPEYRVKLWGKRKSRARPSR